MKEITREWLNRANDDLCVIEEIIGNSNLTNMSAFHAQQAVEKVLKAVIEEYEIAFVRTHKLEFLFEKVRSQISIDVDMTYVRRLDEVYTQARYPSDLGLMPYGKPTTEDAEKFYEFAKIYTTPLKIFSELNVEMNRRYDRSVSLRENPLYPLR